MQYLRNVERRSWRPVRLGLATVGAALAVAAIVGGCPLSGTPATLSPASGPTEGGTKVTIRGEAFSTDAGVLFGDTNATQVTVINDKLIEATSPAHAAGQVTVAIVTSGNRTQMAQQSFEYVDVNDPSRKAPVAAGTVVPKSGPTAGGTRVTITGAHFESGLIVLFGGSLGLDLTIVNDTTLTVVTPQYAAGAVDVALIPKVGPAVVLTRAFTFEEEPITAPAELARVVGAAAANNKQVQVTFSQAMGDGAETPANYKITTEAGGFLAVTGAKLRADKKVVDLTTLTQWADTFDLHVVGVKDAFARNLAAPDGLLSAPNGVDPSRAKFIGIPPNSAAEQIDTDGDGNADFFEMAGWDVTVHHINGTTETFHSTSDPFNPDTDGDGVSDVDENTLLLDARSSDTDYDGIADQEELLQWRSDASDQDTDDDGFGDALEITTFHTSPILADTDGDQLSDRDEVLYRNRNPRLSDLPLPQILIGEFNLEVDERFAYVDEQGQSQTFEKSTNTSLTQTDQKTYSESDTRSNEATDTFSQNIEAGYGDGSVAGGGYLRVGVGFGQERARGYTSNVSEESVKATQRAYSEALTEALTVSQRQEVTRTVESAKALVEVTIRNAGGVAFTLSNLELTARVKDATRRDRYLPMAALRPGGDTTVFNLGPLNSQRGPFIFQNSEIFPNLAQDLLREPRTILFDVANYDIQDEFGRNFAFTSEEINDRTAGITIDFGNGDTEAYRVATASRFNPKGIAFGISMREALTDVLGLNEIQNDTTQITPGADVTDPNIRNSYGTIAAPANGLQVLTRVRGVQTNLALTTTDRRFWVVLSSADVPAGTNFGDIMLRAGDDYLLWYVQDNDDDGLFAREEYIAGSSDENPDTDGDGINDRAEVKDGWEVPIPGHRYKSFPSPALKDTDGDGLEDDVEQAFGTDPRKADTDEDGLSDAQEVNGYRINLLGGGLLDLTPYNGDGTVPVGVNAGADGIVDTAAQPGDTAFNVVGENIGADKVFLFAGEDGVLQTLTLGGDDQFVYEITHSDLFASNPLDRDTDHDGIFDGREALLGSNPNNKLDADTVRDTDRDGVIDFLEKRGWTVSYTNLAGNVISSVVTSDPNIPDTDGDGLPDLVEIGLQTNPRLIDTDDDDINDYDELSAAQFASFAAACADADACTLDPSGSEQHGTNPLKTDTDDDGLADGFELTGWNVQLYGSGTLTPVVSNPLDADTDNDQLNDGEEYHGGVGSTDPNNPNTDGDNATDYTERNMAGRNPLRKDERVRFEYVSIVTIDDCDGSEDPDADLNGKLYITFPDGSSVEVLDMDGCGNGSNLGSPHPLNIVRTFIMADGQSFTAYSNTWQEYDGLCSTPIKDDINSFTNTWDYPATQGTQNLNITDGDCDFNFVVTVSTD